MGLLDYIDNYEAQTVDEKPSEGVTEVLGRQHATANRPASAFAGDANQGTEKSNLFGADPDQGEGGALSAKARQMYKSDINQMAQKYQMDAIDRQSGLQSQSNEHRAAAYSNAQQRAQINFQERAFARTAAIQSETARRQLLSSLFKGAGSVAGGAFAAATYNARNPAQTAPRDPGMGSAYFDSGNYNMDMRNIQGR